MEEVVQGEHVVSENGVGKIDVGLVGGGEGMEVEKSGGGCVEGRTDEDRELLGGDSWAFAKMLGYDLVSGLPLQGGEVDRVCELANVDAVRPCRVAIVVFVEDGEINGWWCT